MEPSRSRNQLEDRANVRVKRDNRLADLEYDARDLDAAKALLSSLEMSRERA